MPDLKYLSPTFHLTMKAAPVDVETGSGCGQWDRTGAQLGGKAHRQPVRRPRNLPTFGRTQALGLLGATRHIPATFTRTQTVATIATALKTEPILANSEPILAEFWPNSQ